MKLLILESPGKVKKVQSFLSNDWQVVASVGHVRDLPEREFGISIPDFVPNYVPTERGKGVLKKLQALAKSADAVYLATDPDREGEAIAWHIVDAIKLPSPKRITYGEITENAIKAAIASPRNLDMSLVNAQEARRILDRLCGFMVSPCVSNAANKKMSAGRVQSPAVRLVVEREKAIEDFVPTTHYGAVLIFESDNGNAFKATWITKGWYEGDYLLDKDLAEKAAAIRSLIVQDCKESESRVAPPAPFTTSSLQQAASNALGFAPKHTMSVAQKLYEQGHITYMRTDSPNLSAEAVEEIREFCISQDWSLVEKSRTWKSKQGAQEAHEAIRPTHFDIAEAGENEDEKALYNLIRLRTLATQLSDAIYDVRILQLSANLDGKPIVFEAKGKVLKHVGWKVLMQDDVATQDTENEEEAKNAVPKLDIGGNIVATDGSVQTKKTKAPPRFSEASLVRELENRGIGRPATFAAIIDTIMKRGYVHVEKKHLVPTPLGIEVIALLNGYFSFADYAFTSTMEESLDDIATGKKSHKDVLTEAHTILQEELSAFIKVYPPKERVAPKFTEFTCTLCGKELVHLQGKRKDGKGDYDFFGCSDRECGANYPNEDGIPGKIKTKPVLSEHKCKCGKALIQRNGAKGAFFGCSAYPKCKKTYQLDENGNPDFGGKK